MVMKEEIIEITYHPEDDIGKKIANQSKTLRLRKVSYQDEKNRNYEFLCNNFEISAQEIAFLYQKRCGIETLFKKMKQNF